MKRIRNHITFANVISLIALFVAMGGTGYAALKLPKNSVGSKQIKKNSVTGPKVKDGSLQAGDFAAGQLPAGPVGPVGPKGDKGATGATGTFGSITVAYAIEPSPTGLADGTKKSYDVYCPAGTVAIGGGSRGDTTDSENTITTSSRPLQTGGGYPTAGQSFQGWRATVFNPSGNAPASTPPADGAIQPEVWAICATPAG